MSPARRLFIALIVLLTAAGGYAAGRAVFRPVERVAQPIAFNHQVHVEENGMECSDCHQFYLEGKHSGLPTLTVCLDCHEEAMTDNPEEQKIRDLAAAGQDDVFRKLFKLPDHAFYSHRRHVGIAGIECETCHGEVALTTEPPEKAEILITMDFCMDCHKLTGVSEDCTRCHR